MGSACPPFDLPFHPWSTWAVSSWAKALWEFCDLYRISLPPSPPELRSGDRFLMDAFWEAGIRSEPVLARLNQCRMFLRVLSLAEIVSCDGRTILPSAWTGSASCGRRPRQETWPMAPPSSALDWPLWQRSLMTTFGVDSRFRSLTTTLGLWDHTSVRSTLSLFCPALDRVFIPVTEDCWHVYGVLPGRRGRRRYHGPSGSLSYGGLLLQPALFPADLVPHPEWVSLLSWDARPIQLPFSPNLSLSPPRPNFYAPEYEAFAQTWFDPPDDPAIYDQFLRAVSRGTLEAVSDGSANTGVNGTAAWCIAFDSSTISHLSAGLRVPGPAEAQCSFRSELVGLLSIAQMIRSVCRFFPQMPGIIQFGTDSQAVLDRILLYPRQPSLGDHSWDLVSLTQQTIATLPQLRWIPRHIRGHQDLTQGPLDTWAKRNIAADARAALVYERVPEDDVPQFPPAPLPPILLGSTFVVHNLASQLRSHVLAPPLKDHWTRLGRFGHGTLDHVAWSSYSTALEHLPQSRRHWVIKSTAGRSAVGVEMVRRRAWRSPVCPRCHREVETAAHVFSCQHSEALELWSQRLVDLQQWLQSRHTQPGATEVIIRALTDFAHQRVSTEIHSTVPCLEQAARSQAALGWEAAMFGFWAPEWVEVQDIYYRFLGKRNSGRRWLALLIAKVWEVSWDLWEHRNGIFHAAEAARLQAERQHAIRMVYASPPPALSSAMRLLLRRPLSARLQDPPRIQDLFIRRMAQHGSSAPVRRLRLQQRRFRQFFRPSGTPS